MGRLLLTLLLSTLTVALYATNGLSPIGYGVQSKGMGGAAVALPLDSFVAIVNPAGIVELGCRADIELGYTFQRGGYEGREGGDTPRLLTSETDHGVWWPAMGATLPLGSCMSVGLAAYVLGASDVSWDPPLLFLGNPIVAGNPVSNTMMQTYYAAITPSFGWRYCKSQAFGVSVSAVFGSCILKGVSQQRTESRLPEFVTDNGASTSIGVNVSIGWLGNFFCDRLRLGIAVVSKSYMSRFSKYEGMIGNYGAFQWPWSASFGLSWSFAPCWIVALDYRYIQWKSNDSMYFSNFANQQNLGGETRGIWDGQGFGWNNQSVAKVGLAWTPFSCLTLRFGYNYNTGVIPTSEMVVGGALTNALIKHHITLGATYRACKGEWSGYFAHGFRRSASSFGPLFPGASPEDRTLLRNEQNELGLAWGVCF